MTESERAFQRAVLETARLLGWRVAHFRAGRTTRGWRTPVAAYGAGFPDLVLCRGDQLKFRELKSADGRHRPEQLAWLTALAAAGADTGTWRPHDWPTIEETLR